VGKNDDNDATTLPFQPPLPGGKGPKGGIAAYGAHGVLSAVIFWAGTELHSLNAKMDGLATKVATIEAKMQALERSDLDARVRSLEAIVAELRARVQNSKEK
jgi:hypothetical protein